MAVPQANPQSNGQDEIVGDPIIAGDGYYYLAYQWVEINQPGPGTKGWHLWLMRVNSSGASDNMGLQDFPYPEVSSPVTMYFSVNMITNADTGTVVSWEGAVQPWIEAVPRAPHSLAARKGHPQPLALR